MKAAARKMNARPIADRADALAAPGKWSQTDTVLLFVLFAATAATRFWRLGYPGEPVFDEGNFVGQAGTYLHGEQYIDPHPPFARELIALGMWLFGPAHPWAWRLSNAAIGTALAGITYALGRRMFASRMVGALAASFILLDGLFLVDSRTGVLEIVYLTLAAVAYLLFFKFLQDLNHGHGKRTLILLGISLGLCLGAKLLLPGVTFLLVIGFLAVAMAAQPPPPGEARGRLILGIWLLVGSTATLAYVAAFLPNYLLLGWGGVHALVTYGRDVLWYESHAQEAFDPRSSPWWSWPLLLHPFIYWQATLDSGQVSTIWFGGNPVLWWASLGAICILCVRLISRPSLPTAFLVSGYFSYLVIEIPITRPMYLYHYMPSQYLAYVALAVVLSECWRGEARRWEQALLLAALAPSAGLAIAGTAGIYAAVVVLIAICVALLWQPRATGKPVCVSLIAAAIAAFVYFFPIWTGLPISPQALDARLWMHQAGVCDWTSIRM